jgi:hypothetical protein
MYENETESKAIHTVSFKGLIYNPYKLPVTPGKKSPHIFTAERSKRPSR